MALERLDNVAEIPFIDSKNGAGRVLSTLTFYDKDKWHVWVPVKGGFLKIQGFPAEQHYFSNVSLPGDLYLHFLDFFENKISVPHFHNQMYGIKDDILNLAASLAKINFLHQKQNEPSIVAGIRRMITTEIEYIFTTCRSIFDLLQECLQQIWSMTQIHNYGPTKSDLRKHFTQMVFNDNGVNRTQGELIALYGLTPALAACYESYADFFRQIQKFRNSIVHEGKVVEVIIPTPRGFAAPEYAEPFCNFGIWTKEHQQPNGLCSLRPALAYVVQRTIAACEDFSKVLEQFIVNVPPMVPGFKVYIRGYYLDVLYRDLQSIERCLWYDED